MKSSENGEEEKKGKEAPLEDLVRQAKVAERKAREVKQLIRHESFLLNNNRFHDSLKKKRTSYFSDGGKSDVSSM